MSCCQQMKAALQHGRHGNAGVRKCVIHGGRAEEPSVMDGFHFFEGVGGARFCHSQLSGVRRHVYGCVQKHMDTHLKDVRSQNPTVTLFVFTEMKAFLLIFTSNILFDHHFNPVFLQKPAKVGCSNKN